MLRVTRYWHNQLIAIRGSVAIRFLILWWVLSAVTTSCESDSNTPDWVDDGHSSISQYLEKNKTEYSKFYTLLVDGNMLSTLYAYNPYGDDYTLFLPTDEAIDRFIQQNGKYESFDELLKDTASVNFLVRYHTLNRKVHTDEFPDGALIDSTLTGDRLIAGFYTDGNNQVIRINNAVPIIKSNLEMSNGYIHVISGVLQKAEISGYDWLQQQPDFSILAQAMKLSEIKKRLMWNKYTLFAEPDSVYHRYGIQNINDLINRIATPGMPLSNVPNAFYQFAAYHIVNGEYFLNDFYWGSRKYVTMGGQLLTIYVGQEIRINTGVDTYGTTTSESGEKTVLDYIRPVSEGCNILTRTGPVHSISDLMYYKPLP